MNKKHDFYDKLSGVPDEDIWLRNHIIPGTTYLFEDCEHCGEWVAYQDRCVCGTTRITKIEVIEIPRHPGEFEIKISGMPDHTVTR